MKKLFDKLEMLFSKMKKLSVEKFQRDQIFFNKIIINSNFFLTCVKKYYILIIAPFIFFPKNSEFVPVSLPGIHLYSI